MGFLNLRPKRILLVLILVIGIGFTARWWLPELLKFLSVNGDLIQTIDSGVDLISTVIVVISAIGGYILLRDQNERVETLDQRNRRVMLDHVEGFWVKGILEKSLHGAALLELGIKEEPTAVRYPWTIKKEATDETLPAGKSMLEIFQEVGMGRSLLILGAPGSGKTTMLLELARELIERARQDDTEPIPVVLNLSSWKEKQTLADWTATQLNLLYYVPKKTAPTWINENRILLLLDGLDEVELDSRFKCIEAINQFRRVHGLTSVVICCRVEEYSIVDTKLSLEGAIILQPLTSEQIETYFDRLGKGLSAIKELLQKDNALQELTATPLMLSVITLAYKDRKVDELIPYIHRENPRKHIFDTYIARMFERPTRTANTSFSKLQTLHYLVWLARAMIQQKLTTFQIEALQPSWLAEVSQRNLYRILVCLYIGLLGGLIGGSIFGPIGLAVGLLVGLILGLPIKVMLEELVNLSNRFMEGAAALWGQSWKWARPGESVYSAPEDTAFDFRVILPRSWIEFLSGFGTEITMVDNLTWSWNKAMGGLGVGLILALGAGLLVGPRSIGLSGLISNLGFGLGLLGALLFGLSVEQVDEATRAGQRLRQTFTYSILAFLASGIIVELVRERLFGSSILGLGLFVGLLAALSLGGRALIQHYLLRFTLSQRRLLPWHLVPFLDYAVDLIFLRRVGGSYIFVHRLLMENFAGMEVH